MVSLTSLRLLAPVLSLSAFAFVLFGLDAMAHRASPGVRRAGFWLTLTALLVTGLVLPDAGQTGSIFGRQMMVWDGLSYFMTWIALLTVLFVVLIGEHYRPYVPLRMSAYYGLLLLSATGLSMLASSNDFLMIFLSIELIGIPSFILSGFLRDRERSNEAAIKFFLIGAFSTAMLAYGISLLYGITGATSLTTLHEGASALQGKAPLTLMACLFIIVSFGFKIALVPFHMWVPDVFEGAPTPIAAYLSVGPKIAGVVIALRVFGLDLPSADLGLLPVFALLAALTMTVANMIGLQQKNVVRLLAYSSIAHMGYVLLGLVAGGKIGLTGVYFYGWTYLFMNLGAFAIVIAVSDVLHSHELAAYEGLAQRSPGLAALLALFLISLAGLPPTAGFVAKFYVLTAAFDGRWVWLVIVAGINTVISVGYYFKILRAMYFKPAPDPSPIELQLPSRVALTITAVATLLIGVGPQWWVGRLSSLVEVALPTKRLAEPAADSGRQLMPSASGPSASSDLSSSAAGGAPLMLPEPSQR